MTNFTPNYLRNFGAKKRKKNEYGYERKYQTNHYGEDK